MGNSAAQSFFPKGLIVSCQIDESEPLHSPEHVALFAKAAKLGGAIGIRAEGIANIAAVLKSTSLPVIGCIRGRFESGWILVTPDIDHVNELIDVGLQYIAVDGTFRKRPNGYLGHEFIELIRETCSIQVVADISTIEEAVAAERAGAVAVSTVLYGRTEDSPAPESIHAYYDFITELSQSVSLPILAEGFIWSPDEAAFALQSGAYASVVGGAITRPRLLTQLFVDKLSLVK